MEKEIVTRIQDSLIKKYGKNLTVVLPRLTEPMFITLFKGTYYGLSLSEREAMILNPEAYTLNDTEIAQMRAIFTQEIYRKLYNQGHISEMEYKEICKDN